MNTRCTVARPALSERTSGNTFCKYKVRDLVGGGVIKPKARHVRFEHGCYPGLEQC
jgi:hypothetical protein